MGKHIIIVDDEQELAELLDSQLQTLGYSTTVFNDPFKASAFIETTKEQVDLIISDVRMPGLSGDLMYKGIKSFLKEKTPPLIFITGYSEISRADALKLGAREIIEKPFRFKELQLNVENILEL